MGKIITVIATSSPVPYERDPRRQITSERAVSIEKTAYYARRLQDGELRELVPAGPVATEIPEAAPPAGKVN